MIDFKPGKALYGLLFVFFLLAPAGIIRAANPDHEAEKMEMKAKEQMAKGNKKEAIELIKKAVKKAEDPRLRKRLAMSLKKIKMHGKKNGSKKKGPGARLPQELRIKLMFAEDDETLVFINTTRQEFSIMIEQVSTGEAMRLAFAGRIKPMKEGLYEIIFQLKLEVENGKEKEAVKVRLSGSTRLKQGQAETVAKIPSGALRISLE